MTRGPARLRVVAGPVDPAGGWSPPGAAVIRVDPADHAAVEQALGRALGRPGDTLLLAVAPCALRSPRLPPLQVAESRCNRCGSCLALGCPAIGDPGGEAMVIDEARCTGCGLCAPLCRGRAIGPALRAL